MFHYLYRFIIVCHSLETQITSMKLRQLECFKALMETGTMTAAAKLINTSQPGVSNLIAALEHQIGFKLFERIKGRLVPTPEARYFYQIAERIVVDVESARRTTKQIAEGKHGQLTIATLPGLGLTIIPKTIAFLRKNRPDTRFKILTRSTDAVRMMIPSQQCDIALVETPVDAFTGLTEILSFECVAILQASNPLAEHEVLTPELIASEPLTTLHSDHATTQQLERAFFSSHIPWRPVVEARFFATSCQIVIEGGGISIVDPMTAAQHINEDLVIRSFAPKIEIEIALMLPGDGPYSRLAQDFVTTFKTLVKPFLVVA
jgi:DNA-binding transcriptional LysR family regulator